MLRSETRRCWTEETAMSKLIRMLPLMLIAAALAIPASASAASSNGRSDRRGSSSDDDSSETRRSGDRDRDSSRRGDSRRGDRRGDSRRDDRRSDERRGSRSADERRRGDSSEAGSYSHSRSSGSRHSSHSSNGHRTSRSYRYGHGHRNGSYRHHDSHRVVVRSSPNVVYVQRPRVVVRHNSYYEPMYLGDQALADMLYQLDRATFSSDKMNIIGHVAARYTLSTHAAKRMVRQLTFSNDRVEALEMLYPRVHDKENWYRVYDLLTFSSDRDRLRSRCGY
jgi:hypothetical protein